LLEEQVLSVVSGKKSEVLNEKALLGKVRALVPAFVIVTLLTADGISTSGVHGLLCTTPNPKSKA
jgi:hypothetical protein